MEKDVSALRKNCLMCWMIEKQLAIMRAKRNFNRLDHSNPAKEESSTTVFRLVEELLKYV
jgi:hypothetical protein